MYVRKAILVCDRCGERVEVSPDCDPLSSFSADDGLREAGWIRVGDDHHLCPDCARAYLAKRDEMERELRRLAGIRTVEFGL